ncbi:serine/arginine repetitive matrix protein 2 [Spatholobus suberectus]|nr:serine/arginine repetitive matrix protein 2 [Spatholobus suberectus]
MFVSLSDQLTNVRLCFTAIMGCCVSTDRSYSSPSSKPCEPPGSGSTANCSKSRAPPPEEETVKEVLSETPKWKPKFEAENPTESEVEKEKPFGKPEEISEASEVCSVSESVSTLAEEEARQRVNRSPAKARKPRSFSGGRRDTTAGKSPARRPEQSPGRRYAGSVRVVQMGNGGAGSQLRRRDAGENSGRRSRSPATRTDSVATRSVVGRSPSARRTHANQSPARVRIAAAESGSRKMVNSSLEGKRSSSVNESLENPLVSLECFIFL